jgi:hypothetical protein
MPNSIIIECHSKGTVHAFYYETTLGRSDGCDLVLGLG